MKVTLICSDANHPVNPWLARWIEKNSQVHEMFLARRVADIPGGDILFLISCSELVSQADRDKYRKTLVLHASDLPVGRGWSPHIWQVVSGATEITLSMLEATDKVDSGNIVKKMKFNVDKTDLWQDINDRLFSCEMNLMDYAVENFDDLPSVEQPRDIEPTYYRRRQPRDSEIDPRRSIEQQFDLIRVCDPDRYPAYFKLHGQKYKLILEKIND